MEKQLIGKRHSHNDKQVDYWIHVTNKCNWFCDYCIVDTHNTKDTQIENVLKTIQEDVKDNSFVSLTGGEIGTLSKSEIESIFILLESKQCKICIDTNGLFLRKYSEYYNRVFDYFYHCSEKLTLEEDIFKDISDPENKLTFMIVVSDSNFENSIPFLTKWNNVLFHVHGAMTNGNGGNTLSNKFALKLFHACHKLENVNKEHLTYIINLYAGKNEHVFIDSRK